MSCMNKYIEYNTFEIGDHLKFVRLNQYKWPKRVNNFILVTVVIYFVKSNV